jgi:lipopolysaccharide/colanic/teichoic acid biosynthesis glycosyltransferase
MGVAVTDFRTSAVRRRSAVEYSKVVGNDAVLELVKAETVDGSVQIFPRERSELASRVVNVLIAAVALIVMAPVMLLVALAIRLTSKGPIIYSQVRVGVDRRYRSKSTYDRRGFDYGGRPFTMYKFRTMKVDAEANGQAVWAQKNDPRTTSIGKFLRTTRLDELPQLWNVIRGDMNIVGPRPERPTIFAQLREDIPLYAQRQRVKPGITGWAQINQAYDSCLDDVKSKVQYDLQYVQRQGLLHDLQIMSMTVPVMIRRQTGW